MMPKQVCEDGMPSVAGSSSLNIRKLEAGMSVTITAAAGTSKYSVPVAQTPMPTVPSQLLSPVASRSSPCS